MIVGPKSAVFLINVSGPISYKISHISPIKNTAALRIANDCQVSFQLFHFFSKTSEVQKCGRIVVVSQDPLLNVD